MKSAKNYILKVKESRFLLVSYEILNILNASELFCQFFPNILSLKYKKSHEIFVLMNSLFGTVRNKKPDYGLIPSF